MAKKKKSDRKIQSTTDEPLSANPFAALSNLRGSFPEGSAAEPEPASPAETPEPQPEPEPAPAPRRAVVRYQRKGRGGKEVTVIEKLELERSELDAWCGRLKRALGCGGFVENQIIVLSGDQRDRLPGLLDELGVVRVTTS